MEVVAGEDGVAGDPNEVLPAPGGSPGGGAGVQGGGGGGGYSAICPASFYQAASPPDLTKCAVAGGGGGGGGEPKGSDEDGAGGSGTGSTGSEGLAEGSAGPGSGGSGTNGGAGGHIGTGGGAHPGSQGSGGESGSGGVGGQGGTPFGGGGGGGGGVVGGGGGGGGGSCGGGAAAQACPDGGAGGGGGAGGQSSATYSVSNSPGIVITTTGISGSSASGSGSPQASVGAVQGLGSPEGPDVPLSCSGASGTSCGLTVSLAVKEKLRGGRVTAITANSKGRVSHRSVLLARAAVTLLAGQTQGLLVGLDRAGQSLLGRRHRLKVKLTVVQTGPGAKRRTVASRTLVLTSSRKLGNG